VVRPLKAFGLPNCLRVSTGTDADNQLCMDAFRAATRRARLEGSNAGNPAAVPGD